MILKKESQKLTVSFFFNYQIAERSILQKKYFYLFFKQFLFYNNFIIKFSKKIKLKKLVFVRGPRGPKSSFVKLCFVKFFSFIIIRFCRSMNFKKNYFFFFKMYFLKFLELFLNLKTISISFYKLYLINIFWIILIKQFHAWFCPKRFLLFIFFLLILK